MKECTYRLSLSELLNRPMGLLSLVGSDGDGAAEPTDKPEDKGGASNDDDKSGDKGDGKSKDEGAKPDAKDRRITGLEEERDRHFEKRKEAETALKEANATIAKLQKDGTPDDALKTANDELTSTNASLTESNKSLMLENAFLKATGYDWVDPEAALKLANLSAVEFDEKTNKATGLESALAKLAKDKPYLLKAEKKDEDEKPGPRGTGKPPAPGKQGQQDAAARAAALRKKYPGLRR